MALYGSVVGRNYVIHDASELVTFSDIVNEDSRQVRGYTVLLDSDIDLTGIVFKPIGCNGYDTAFVGTFDGQGHTISNLVTNTSMSYTGLFGYLMDSTIKNVVLDGTCTIESSSSHNVGGIVGSITISNGKWAIENAVNMGSVTSKIQTEYDSYTGGISGESFFYKNESYIRNCVNYGSVTFSGASKTSYIGGITGSLYYREYNLKGFIQNCLNYGSISESGTIEGSLYIGGISGETRYGGLQNCVNYGAISTDKSSESDNTYIGSITGELESYLSTTNCYWAKSTIYPGIGEENPFPESTEFSDDFVLNETVSAIDYNGTSLIEALNKYASYYTLKDYSRWVLNKGGNTISFNVNGENAKFTLNSKLILLPDLANRGNMNFDGWFTDSEYTTRFTDAKIESSITLYGKFEENNETSTITFNTEGGSSIEQITWQSGSAVRLPVDPTREGCTFAFWETEYGDIVPEIFTVPAHDVTLHAAWECTHIKSAKDLVDFSRIVNMGANFSGTTVFLDSDITFTEELSRLFEPIGRTDKAYFLGTFDGQGHKISNLVKRFASDYAGLFGYSRGLTIKNVVIDSTCSFSNSVNYLSVKIGGIIGYCSSEYSPCTIEDCVNNANIVSTKDLDYQEIHMGGIVGCIAFYEYESTVKSCTNYGTITHSGVSGSSHMGGIVGESVCYYSENTNTIDSCINNGAIIYNGQSSYSQYIDGIVGKSENTLVKNCKNNGKLSAASSIYALSFAWVMLLMLMIH